ncbi:LuxR C-terminal-related transcriptional regulator [Mycolicibacter arupensis]|uniref:LuxR C-terminal-related transcriptional regulator n=2 Tax=Mycolicibacter arupensis TaxID=342002 RepID=UPI001F3327E0|nr:LuxR family transcriptional regulator [Mycolicibacter arupensis]
MSEPRLSWPLTGRTGELHTLHAALSAPDASGVVVCGAAGVGKSRICRELLSDATPPGQDVRWVVCTSSARSIPLGAFATWVHAGVTDSVALIRSLIEALTAAPASTAVVGIDDVHLIDDLSAFVVHQIVQRGLAKVILTLRDGESIPDAVREIWAAGRFERLDLQPLSSDEVLALLTATLGGPVESAAAQRLWKLTLGNALYLRNIVESELAAGRIVRQPAGPWRWIGDPIIPPSLAGFLEPRIGALPGPVSDVVDVLAVAEPIDLVALTRITDPAAVEEAETRGLITLEPATGGAQVRLAHPLYGEVRRGRAATTRLRRLRGLVAAELADLKDRDDIAALVRRATLLLESDVAPDADLFTRAASGAVWLADLGLADRLAQAAVRAGAGPESSFVSAHALSWLGRGDEADALLAKVENGDLDDRERARLAFLRASNMLWALGQPARAKEIIDAAAATVPPQARSYIDAFLAVYWFATDDLESARQASEHLDLDALPPVVGAEIAWVLSAISADAGRTGEALTAADTGYAIAARSLDAPHMMFNIADAHVSALIWAGRLDDALAVAERVRRQAADLPGAAQLLGAAIAGRAALGAGRLDSADQLLGQVAVAFSDSGHGSGWGYRYLLPQITAVALRGRTDDAAAALERLDAVRRPFRLLEHERSLARAWVAAGQGAVSEAIAILGSAAEAAAAKGQFAAEVICLQTAAQFGDRTGTARLRELEAVVEGPRVGLAARFSAALRDGDAAELAAVSLDFEHIGDLIAAVDAAAQAAIVYRRKDLRGTALVCGTRAATLAEQGGGVSTPALRQAAQPLPLTEREQEIVMLIGAGLSNREIAERLTLSVRTVESHIYRAMMKTDTKGRDELAALRPRRRSDH